MKNQSNTHHSSNFWLGFAAGTVGASAVAYLLGTKKGRQTLKKVLEMSENIEEQSPELIEGIHEVINNLIDTQSSGTHPSHKIKESEDNNTLEDVMDKIKHVGQPKKYVKQFFAKSGKIIDP